MKLTIEDVMGEESGVKKKKPKASKEKPQRKWGRKDRDEDVYDEDDVVADEDTTEDADTELEDEETDGAVESETEEEADVDEDVPKKFAGLRLAVLILAALFGLGLIIFGIRGVIGRMQLEQTIETPTDDYDSSYDEALDAPEESFDDVNAGREETADPNAVPEGEVPTEGDPNADTTMSTAEEPSGIAVETPEHKTSLEEEIALLKAEISRLNEVVASAQNNEAMKEQELNNAKAMLEASTAREAELQRQLDALSTNE